MEIELSYKADVHRRLCIKKDLIELSHWIDVLGFMNTELNHFSLIEKQLLHHQSIAMNLKGFRRKNTLIMATLCQYEQTLNKELEFGKKEYDLCRAKEHEKKREIYTALVKEFQNLKEFIYNQLNQYQRK